MARRLQVAGHGVGSRRLARCVSLSPMNFVSLLITILPFIAAVVVLAVVLRAFRRAPAKGSARYDVAAGSGVWFAQVRTAGWRNSVTSLSTMMGGWGQLRVDAGVVSFIPDGAQGPAWTIPANQLRIEGSTATGTGFTVEAAQLGRITIQPSTSKMARWASAGTTRLSDHRTTQDVLTILRGWGAHY